MHWSSFGIPSVVKPEPRGKKTGSCRMSDALRGVMWSSASYSSSSANTITSLNILRFIWRCFTVAVVIMSLRAFYDCTLIVESLFYTESYFRIQYVLLYNKCVVWRKLNKCCLKTAMYFLLTLYWFYWHVLCPKSTLHTSNIHTDRFIITWTMTHCDFASVHHHN